jgi:hypothetical protein
MSKQIIISGTSGLTGSAIRSRMIANGYECLRVVRSPRVAEQHHDAILWDIEHQTLDGESLEDVAAVIHLSGANISDNRWTDAYKKEIYDSRIQSTALLSRTLAALNYPPKVFMCASAVGIYGHEDANFDLNESSPAGDGFLAKVCKDWEAATQPAKDAGIRTVHLRFGVVLSPRGGALVKMLPIFKLGLGGPIASGRQMMSWIALDEIPRIVQFLMERENISGPVNVTSPGPVTNKQFTADLGRAVRRPAFLPVPRFALRLLLGEMADELLIGGAKVIPQKLLDNGYTFLYPDLPSALKAEPL